MASTLTSEDLLDVPLSELGLLSLPTADAPSPPAWREAASIASPASRSDSASPFAAGPVAAEVVAAAVDVVDLVTDDEATETQRAPYMELFARGLVAAPTSGPGYQSLVRAALKRRLDESFAAEPVVGPVVG